MSDQLRSIAPGSVDGAPASEGPRWRSRVLVTAVVVLVMLGLGVVELVARGGGEHSQPSPSRPSQSQGAASPTATARLAAVTALLHQRSAAMTDHDRAAFLATVDPADAQFRASQRQMFANSSPVKFASWSYTMGAGSHRLSEAQTDRYGAPTWSPTQFALHYRIAGFDRSATDLRQYPTFVERGARWYLASLSDFRSRGEVSATDLWDYAPVRVFRRRSVLVLGPTSELGTMRAVADEAQEAIPKVSAVWGLRWSRRVVIQVPSSQHEMAQITGDRGDLDQIAALTSAEVSNSPGRPEPVGDRVTINPSTWPSLDHLGATIALTHELTHVASRAETGTQTPKWLAEGFADYVGFLDSGLAVTSVAAELATQVRAGHVPTQLPSTAAFNGSARDLSTAYEGGWLACRDIAERYGQRKLLRFYRRVGTSRRSSAPALRIALRDVLGLTPRQFTAQWRAYVRAQLT